ncbi:MAG: NAD(P)/FAD-dependent oxidoreductase [Gemmatimonadetes bacterium]|nr:NAD(P)/FAD-dependent oxidoreductase [Gemmatimonadota bacterium]
MNGLDFDVVVVGASAAGLRAAALAARSGMQVAVFERKADPAFPARSWIVTSQIEAVLSARADGVVVHRTGVMEMFAGRACEAVRLDPPDLVLERSRLIPLLRREAEAAGVEVHPDAAVEGVRFTSGSIHVSLAEAGAGRLGRKLRTRHLIGADGVRSLVARRLGAGAQQAVPVLQAKVELPDDHDPDVTRVWFHRDRSRFFYWLIPDSKTTGVAGLVAEQPGQAGRLLDEFLGEHGLRPLEYQGAMIPLHRPGRRIAWHLDGSRVLLVGDAAAHVKVTTVGGVVSGLWGAEAAARSLIRGTSYGKELRAVQRELYLHDLIRWLLDRFDQCDYEGLLALLNPRLRAYLRRQNRDTIAMSPFPALLAQPRLLRLVVKALLFPRREPVGLIVGAREPAVAAGD